MSSFSRLLTITLGLTAAGCAVLAYQQYYLLRTARGNIDALEKERTSLRDKIAQLERTRGERSKWPATTGGTGGPAVPPDSSGETNGPPSARAEGANFNRMRAMMESPQAQKFMAMQQKAALDARYAALFRKLNLSPAELEKFKDLLVERQTSVMDVMAAARNQGMDLRANSQEISQLIRDAQGEVDDNIRGSLGDTAYQEYKDYEHTLPMRNTVNQLEQRLSYTSEPLRPDQVDQLTRILAETNPQRTADARTGGNVLFGGIEGAMMSPQVASYFAASNINDDALTRAQGILTSSQIDALKQLQQEQQARAQFAPDMRRGFPRGTATPTTGGPVPSPAPLPPGGG